MKDLDLRDMCRVDLEDEVMLLRAQVKVQQNELIRVYELLDAGSHWKDNEILSLKRQLGALVCSCCDDEPTAPHIVYTFPTEGRT